jgi:alditol oxidase
LPQIESALRPFGMRPHWGKLFTASAEDVEAVYPKLPEFRRLLETFDRAGKFRNEFIARYVWGEADAQPGT